LSSHLYVITEESLSGCLLLSIESRIFLRQASSAHISLEQTDIASLLLTALCQPSFTALEYFSCKRGLFQRSFESFDKYSLAKGQTFALLSAFESLSFALEVFSTSFLLSAPFFIKSSFCLILLILSRDFSRISG